MKTTLTILAICLLIGAGVAVAALAYQVPSTTEVDVLNDITDKQLATVDYSQILSLYNLSSDNLWKGGIFTYSNVTDVSYNPTLTAQIDAANQWLSNELDRDKEVKGFQKNVSAIVSNATKDAVGRQHSSIYLPIVQQLIHLSQSKAQKRILLVYSDLMENDPGLSFYNQRELQLIQTNPNSVKKMLESRQALPSLTGIEIHLVYQPTNTEQDSEYRIVAGFYQSMLEAKGATVSISANLSH